MQSVDMPRARAQLFGVWIDAIDARQSIERITQLIDAGEGGQHVVLNASKVVLMEDSPRLRSIIEAAAIVNADGQSIVWAGRLLGVPIPERVTGIDLMWELLAEAQKLSWPVYFLGAKPAVLAAFVDAVGASFPQLVIAGSHHGYFDDDQAMAAEVAGSGASIVFIGIPSPRKEYFAHECRREFASVLTMGVGGSFDVYAGVTRRAPDWAQRIGMEWAFRLTQEPRRMWRRYLIGNIRFLAIVIRELHNNRRGSA